MAGGSHAQGVFSKILMEPGAAAGGPPKVHTFNDSSEPYDFLSEDMARRQRIIGGNEIRGTRMSPSERTREGARFFYGTIRKYISPAEMDTLIPKFLGAEVTDVFGPDDDIPYFGMLIDRNSGLFGTPATSIFQYTDCKVDKAIFRGRAPQAGEEGEPDMVTAELHVIGSNQVETAWPDPAPTFGTASNYAPYVFSDATVSFNSVAADIEEFVIVCDNHILPKYTNALTPHSLIPRTRTIRVMSRSVWNDDTDTLYDQAAAGATGNITLTNGSFSTLFEFGTLQVNGITPSTRRGKGQIDLVLDMVARSTSSNAFDLKITNVPA